jgi:hypothetical protein
MLKCRKDYDLWLDPDPYLIKTDQVTTKVLDPSDPEPRESRFG